MNTHSPTRFSFRRLAKYLVLGVIFSCTGLVALAALSNIGLPQRSPVIDRLSPGEKDRLAEVYHLRQTVGESAWPGFGKAALPLIVYNEEYAFLVEYPGAPPDGWYRVPDRKPRGQAWEIVPGDTYNGQPYYRQPLASGETPQAFTVQVGEAWAGSLTNKEWMEIYLRQQFKNDFGPLSSIIPFRIVVPLFVRGADGYISALNHEWFHAYQGLAAGGRLEAAETHNRTAASLYPWDDDTLQAEWQTELDLLHDALKADTSLETANLTAQFLEQRARRRQSANIQPDLVKYEQEREWEEGLARYIELEMWRLGAVTPGYTPLPAVSQQPDFKAYQGFPQRWSQELDQMRRMADDEGDGRFYYSGMAQAYLLDKLLPGWKDRAFEPGVFLDALLAEAIAQ